ncbi:MAG: SPFH domain-containing protein [Bacilli bacterium]
MITTLLIFAIILILIFIFIANIRVVAQTNAYIIESLGSYKTTWQNGLHVKVPFLERVAAKISLKEQVIDFPPQPVITKDNVTMQIDTVVYYAVTDPKLYLYGVNNPIAAIENLTATTLRNIIGDLELDESLTSRDHINTKMRSVLDEATDPWGIKINRVELKNILPPADIQQAMEKQMRAEREKREAILMAEGEKASKILVAEGNKESAILEAQAKKEAKVLSATANKEATILEAQGEAQAILAVNVATAEGLERLKEVNIDNALISLKSLDSLEKLADGKSTKLIIPSNIQGLASLTASLSEVLKDSETDISEKIAE